MNKTAENPKLPQNLDQDWVLRKCEPWYKSYILKISGRISAAVIKKAKEAYNKGGYRWSAEIMNKVIFAEPDNTAAKNLQTDILEQLGYWSENGTGRNEYLMGACELRNRTPKIMATTASPDTLNAMTPDIILDYFGIHIIEDKANGKKNDNKLGRTWLKGKICNYTWK